MILAYFTDDKISDIHYNCEEWKYDYDDQNVDDTNSDAATMKVCEQEFPISISLNRRYIDISGLDYIQNEAISNFRLSTTDILRVIILAHVKLALCIKTNQ